jgi:hypothetical protein
MHVNHTFTTHFRTVNKKNNKITTLSNDIVTELLSLFHRYTGTVQSQLWNYIVLKYNIIPKFAKITIPNISPD